MPIDTLNNMKHSAGSKFESEKGLITRSKNPS